MLGQSDILSLFPDAVSPEPNSGCWLWTRAICDRRWAYGQAHLSKQLCSVLGYEKSHRNIKAHRLSYMLSKGLIPQNLHVLHKCDVMLCCNPEHLYLGDDAQNARDRDKRGRHKTPMGEKHKKSKLTADAVREIRAHKGKLPNGEAQRLAAKYGVSVLHISDVRGGKIWRHVPCE